MPALTVRLVVTGDASDAYERVNNVLDTGTFQDAINDWEDEASRPIHVKQATVEIRTADSARRRLADLRRRIRAFVQATPEQQDLMAACAFLERGKATGRQGDRVRPHLETLETRELAVRRGDGWRLTPAGREAKATYLALGVAMCESAARATKESP